MHVHHDVCQPLEIYIEGNDVERRGQCGNSIRSRTGYVLNVIVAPWPRLINILRDNKVIIVASPCVFSSQLTSTVPMIDQAALPKPSFRKCLL